MIRFYPRRNRTVTWHRLYPIRRCRSYHTIPNYREAILRKRDRRQALRPKYLQGRRGLRHREPYPDRKSVV